MANFIPPAIGASQVIISCQKVINQVNREDKHRPSCQLCRGICQFCVNWGQSWPQAERQTDKQIIWHHIRVYVDFFFQLNLLPPYPLPWQGDKCCDIAYLNKKLLCSMSVCLWQQVIELVFVKTFPNESRSFLFWLPNNHFSIVILSTKWSVKTRYKSTSKTDLYKN